MVPKFSPLGTACAAAVAALSIAGAAFAQTAPASDSESGRLWFVELAGKPVADGASLSAVTLEKTRFKAAAAAAGVQYTERRSFNTLFNGYSVEISAENRRKLAKVAGVRALYPVEKIDAPNPIREESAPDLVAAINLTGAATAQNSLGLSGAGVKVGIIDSGLDIDHPAFGGTGVRGTTPFPSARVVAGHDFVGDNFDGSNSPVPDGDPRDCAATGTNANGASASGGHGTHVAGIVGANGGGIRGVAPQVSFGAYRVFGCYGSTFGDIMIAAMERALADGMQVINMSIGSRAQWPQYPTAQAASRLAKKGVVQAASIGNNGPGGSAPDALFAAGAPGLGDTVIGVASYDNAQRAFMVAGTPYGFNAATGSPNAPSSGNLPLARTWTGAAPNPATSTTAAPVDDGCAVLPAGSLTGTAVLIRRGTCGFYQKAFNAQQAGAAAVILYNNQVGAVNPTVAGTPAITIPVVAITAAQGVAIHNVIAGGPATLTWTSNFVGFPFGTGGLISGFSSFGLGADLSFKPNLGAPGGGIISTYPLELGGSATLSGTSMSSPHVAGAAALILQAVPTAALGKTGPIVGRNAPPMINMMTRLMNTAKPKAWSGNAALGFLDHAFRQGAGMIDIVAAVQSEQFVVPSQIATGESQAGPVTQRLTIRNDSLVPVTYAVGHTSAVAAGPNAAGAASWTLGGVFDAPAGVSFSSSSVVVPAKGTATVDVTITANAALPDRSLYGGYVTLTPQAQGTALLVPYAGLKGDYQATQILRPGANVFPWLTTFNGATFFKCPVAGCTYTMANATNIPYVLLTLAHQARVVKLEAFDLASGQSRGVISEDEFVPRNTTPGGFFDFSWSGDTSLGTQPNGSYFIRVTALKPLGDAANPAHVETWDSPPVTIARP